MDIGSEGALVKAACGQGRWWKFPLAPRQLGDVPLYLKAASSSAAFTGNAYREESFSFLLRRRVGGCLLLHGGKKTMTGFRCWSREKPRVEIILLFLLCLRGCRCVSEHGRPFPADEEARRAG